MVQGLGAAPVSRAARCADARCVHRQVQRGDQPRLYGSFRREGSAEIPHLVHWRRAIEHDPEKWIPVFGKGSCSTNEIERDDDSKNRHLAAATDRRKCATTIQGGATLSPFLAALRWPGCARRARS